MASYINNRQYTNQITISEYYDDKNDNNSHVEQCIIYKLYTIYKNTISVCEIEREPIFSMLYIIGVCIVQNHDE